MRQTHSHAADRAGMASSYGSFDQCHRIRHRWSLGMVKKAGERGARAPAAARNSFQVLVYACIGPLTGRELHLTESTGDEAGTKRILNRSGRRLTRNRTFGLRRHSVRPSTRGCGSMKSRRTPGRGYEAYARKHIKPALGHVSVGKVTVRLLEEFYAELRRCRLRCDGRPAIDHRTDEPHECRVVFHRWPPGTSWGVHHTTASWWVHSHRVSAA
jgi:hypothetical protein